VTVGVIELIGKNKDWHMFERRHHEAIASVIGKIDYTASRESLIGNPVGVRESIIELFINLFKVDNPQFTSERFVKVIAKAEGRNGEFDGEFDCQYCGKKEGH
jgi:hypothetical protein